MTTKVAPVVVLGVTPVAFVYLMVPLVVASAVQPLVLLLMSVEAAFTVAPVVTIFVGTVLPVAVVAYTSLIHLILVDVTLLVVSV